MRLFHATSPDAANAIMREGFRDAEGGYMFVDLTLRGVFLSDVPLDGNEGCKGSEVIEVVLPDEISIDEFELIQEESTGYREWLMPAALINANAAIQLLTEEQAEAVRDTIRWDLS